MAVIKKVDQLNEVDEFYNEGLKRRQPFESDWFLNLAFVLGKQYSQWSLEQQRLIAIPRPSFKVRVVANRMLPIVRVLLAKLTRAKPILYVTGENKSHKSRYAAKVGWKVLQSLWDTLQIRSDIYELALYIIITGTGFMAPYYNNNEGEELKIDETQPDGTVRESIIRTGEMSNMVLSPFEVIPQAGVFRHKELKKLMRTSILPVEDVRDFYDYKKLEPEGVQMSPMELSLQQFLKTEPTELKDSVRIKELRELPSRKFPKGRLLVSACGEILFSGPIPKEFSERGLGIAKFDFMRIGKRYWGFTILSTLRNLQRRYNLSRSEIAMYVRDFCKGKWLIPRTARINDTALTDEPGERVEYTPIGGAKPEVLRGPELPLTVFRNLEGIKAEIDDLSGVHDVSQAKAPDWVKSGVAIDLLQEQDSTQLAPTLGLFEESLADFGKILLRVVQHNYKEPRTLRTFSKEFPDIILERFLGADLSGHMEVTVSLGSALPQSRQARVNYILGLWNAKLIQNPKLALQLIEMQDMESVYKEELIDEAAAHDENDDMAEGIGRVVMVWDAHITHAKIHFNWLKDPDHRDVDKKIKQLIMAHAANHLQKIKAQMSPEDETVPANLSGEAMGAKEKVEEVPK